MFGADAFGSPAFGFVDVAVPPLSFDPFVAHLVGREPAVAISGSEATFHVDGQQPISLTFGTMQVPP
jgi:hypothetical protein